MLAEFAARMNCGGADVASTSSFMREMMHSQTRGSYDNVIATQTFGDEDEEEVTHCRQHSCCVQSCADLLGAAEWLQQITSASGTVQPAKTYGKGTHTNSTWSRKISGIDATIASPCDSAMTATDLKEATQQRLWCRKW